MPNENSARTKLVLRRFTGDVRLVLLAVVLVLISSLIFLIRITDGKAVVIGSLSYQVEIVETNEDRQKGLGGRASLGDNKGMLFVFKKQDFHVFWMKDMKFPLDIVWIDENMKIVDIERNAKPEEFPKNYVSHLPAKYVLEVNAGQMHANGIQIGQKVNISGL